MPRIYTKTPPVIRFWAKVHKATDETCWIWQAGQDGHGYGMFFQGDRTTGAHRFAYEMVNGSLPDGWVVDHLCRTPLCVNPLHLDAVPIAENCRRGLRGALYVRAATCKRGHPRTPENLSAPNPRGYRCCNPCRMVKYREKRAAATYEVAE